MTGNERWLCRITPAGAGKTAIEFNELFNEQDHPRRCGENFSLQCSCFRCSGSPPQVRGKLQQYFPCFFHPGITPAGAGKTIIPCRFSVLAQDHPRRCGENQLRIPNCAICLGSPPQVRGKLGGSAIDYTKLRITPAGAGKTQTSYDVHGADRDHPRRCGENLSVSLRKHCPLGSPPQVRGKPKKIL